MSQWWNLISQLLRTSLLRLVLLKDFSSVKEGIGLTTYRHFLFQTWDFHLCHSMRFIVSTFYACASVNSSFFNARAHPYGIQIRLHMQCEICNTLQFITSRSSFCTLLCNTLVNVKLQSCAFFRLSPLVVMI